MPYQPCDTLLYQGIGASQTQLLKYTQEEITATTGEQMFGQGKNGLKPLTVAINPIIGEEIQDIFFKSLNDIWQYFNPINLISFAISGTQNDSYGFQINAPYDGSTITHTVKHHSVILKNFSIGQTTDHESHKAKYDAWKLKNNRSENLILYGVSRGTAATINAFTAEKYPEVKLVILEGAIDSVPHVIEERVKCIFKNEAISKPIAQLVNSGLAFFTQYKPEARSPLDCVNDFPEGIPIVFITSKIDTEVPAICTYNIARSFAAKGKNDVYLLELENSKHPDYMFSNQVDRDNYETLIHAVYRRYGIQHDQSLAARGEPLLEASCLAMSQNNTSRTL